MHCIEATKKAGKKVGINAFAPATAKKYIEAGVDFILVGADVAMLARSSEALADTYIGDAAGGSRSSY